MNTSVYSIEKASDILDSIDFSNFKNEQNILIQIFSGEGKFALKEISNIITNELPNSICIGATTDGEIINQDVTTMQNVISITSFENTTLKSYSSTNHSSHVIGNNLANELATERTKLIIILSDGTTTNGDELLKGIYENAPNIKIAGGMAGDNGTFTQTYILHQNKIIKNGAVGVALDSDILQVKNHYSFDWQNIGKKLIITKSEKNRVFTIDNKPATSIYTRYLGNEVLKKMSATGIEFPLVMEINGVKVARAMLAIHDDDSLSFAGNIPQNIEVQFGFGNTASIINNSVKNSTVMANKNIETFFIYSCMARRRYMPENISVEIIPFANCAPTAGFFTYGEFFHTPNSNELMNQTLTVVALSESSHSIFEDSKKSNIEPIQYAEVAQTFNALSNLIKTSTDELNETFELFDTGQFILFKWKNTPDLSVEYVSNNVTNILGYSTKSFQENIISFTNLIHKDDIQKVKQNIQKAVSDININHFIHEPYRVKKSDGKYLWLYETTNIIRDKDKNATHLVGYLTDITSRKQDEERLNLYGSIFNNSSEAIVITDSENKILFVNPAFTSITGYQESEAIGNVPNLLSSGHYDKEFYQNIWKEINEVGKWQGEIWNRRKNGELYAEWLSISTIKNNVSGDIQNYIALFSDITEMKMINERIEFLAHHDALTGLPNRILFQDRIHQAILHANRNSKKVALLYVDIDHFKSINDTLGHKIGDFLLIEIVKRFKNVIREDDTISRQGGDEFLILIDNVDDIDDILMVVKKINGSTKEIFNINDHQIHTSSSIGIAIYPDNGDDFDTLLQHADTAMYHAKHDGRNTYHFFTDYMHSKAKKKHYIQNYLHDAIPNQEFSLYFQPQYCIKTNKMLGVEALLRWTSSELGEVSPIDFIPISEENGQVIEIGNWVLDAACQQLCKIKKLGLHDIKMAINISALQFKQADFIDNLLSLIEHYNLPASAIELELTESILISDVQRNVDTLKELKKVGFMLAIDDFGTGYSSLSYLKQFPADVLKIDRSFINDLADDEDDASIVSAIIGLCKSFKIQVVAEGVETTQQLEYLQEHGCDIIQGYLFSKPLKSKDLMEKLKLIL